MMGKKETRLEENSISFWVMENIVYAIDGNFDWWKNFENGKKWKNQSCFSQTVILSLEKNEIGLFVFKK